MAYVLVLVLIVGAVGFYHWWAPFGGRLRGVRRSQAEASGHYKRGRFINQVATSMEMTLESFTSMMAEQLRPGRYRRPRKQLKPESPDVASIASAADTQVVWMGHSSFLVRISGKTVLLDPVLSRRASPFQWIGPKRFAKPPISIQDIPAVDAVVISHDHYDHLDYGTVKRLRSKVGHFYVPLGLGAHLERWGVKAAAITELDWWSTAQLGDIELICTPSRHFSGRRLGDRFATLWASWVIRTKKDRLFFSGDTGYGPHFAEIGKRYGPFDLSLMECGQYDRRWADIHMMPEQTVQAAQDLRSKRFIPIHWGAFTLAFHDWTDSVERALKAARKVNLPAVTPRIGQIVHLHGSSFPTTAWWKEHVTPKP
jgi:L-ascorbate metabolism protein UlaG (beta-lactamase superfamily)